MYKERTVDFPTQYTYYNGNTDSQDDYYQPNPRILFSSGGSFSSYKDAIKKRSDATTNFSAKKFSASIKKGTVFSEFKKSDGRMYTQSLNGLNGPVTWLDPPSTPKDKAWNKALESYFGSVQNAFSAMQGGTFMGELRETLQMIRSPAKSLVRSLNSYVSTAKKHARYRSKKDRLAALNDTYLEYTFGWAPLVSDIKSSVEAASRLARNPPTIRVHGYGHEDVDFPSATFVSSVGSGTNIGGLHSYRNTGKTEIILTGAVTGSASIGSFQSEFGFTAEEFLPTLWNLIPFSFVADYFANVGGIITSASYLGSNFAYNCAVERRTGTRKYSVSGIGGLSSEATGKGGGTISWESECVTLERYRFVPTVPELSFEPPNTTQVFNLASLFASAILSSKLLNR